MRLAGWIVAALMLLPGIAGAQTLTFTAPGNTSFVVPAGVHQINFGAYGAAAIPSVSGPNGGAGAAFCQRQITVTPGQTVFINVGAAAVSIGGNSWFNIASNLQPTGPAQGCIGSGSQLTVAEPGLFGTINSSGGLGGNSATGSSGGGGGGGGAGGPGGSGGAGGNAVGNPGGTAGIGGSAGGGFPAGGNGGAGGTFVVGEETGGNGDQPGGGGGGGAFDSLGPATAGGGANGQVIAIFILTPPPVTSGASQMFLTWPG